MKLVASKHGGSHCCPLHAHFLLCLFFDAGDGRDMWPPKCQLTFNGLHCIISQKIGLFMTTSVRTLNSTDLNSFGWNGKIWCSQLGGLIEWLVIHEWRTEIIFPLFMCFVYGGDNRWMMSAINNVKQLVPVWIGRYYRHILGRIINHIKFCQRIHCH
jgi:hypothetical protein